MRVWSILFVFHCVCVAGSTGQSANMNTLSSSRRRTLAHTVFNRMQEDEKHKADDHSYWYFVKRSSLPANLCDNFVQLHQDSETSDFLEMCYQKADWVFTQIYHSLAKSILSWFMENTSVNGWLGRGSMFVLSRSQFVTMMDIDEGWNRENMLDLGAGDGEVTQKLAPYFQNVYATETSKPMVTRLKDKGYKVLDLDTWDNGSIMFDFVNCMNLLDRCDTPVKILHSIKKVLKPNGRVIVAIVLPFSPWVEFGARDHKPTENIQLQGTTFEEQSISLVRDVFEPAGFSLEKFTRVPYLCEGDMESSFYMLDDALFVLSLKGDS